MSTKIMHLASYRTLEDVKNEYCPPTDRIDYLPWGTRSLRLAIRNCQPEKILICPEPYNKQSERIASNAKGEEGTQIEVSWGGGWEKGIEIGEGKNPVYVYFNVTHKGEMAADSYEIDFVAKTKKDEKILEKLPIILQKPAYTPKVYLKPIWKKTNSEEAEYLLEPNELNGTAEIPLYMPRWWPEAGVTYAPRNKVGKPPEIRINCRRNVGEGYSQLLIYMKPNSPQSEALLAKITGDVQFPLVDLQQISANLFYFSGHWALRIWLFWLDKKILKQISPDKLTDEEKAMLENWDSEQEIPDAERVDLILDKKMNLRYVCSDLHWHELWASCKAEKPINVSIAGKNFGEVTIRGLQGLKVVLAGQAQKYVPQPKKEFNPSDEIANRLSEKTGIELGEGEINHKHTPFFHDVIFDSSLASNDVREG